ncbi:hypothetical protein J437_LFUL004140 [Ladona fulva]|uniref:Uncharacterized protein n=1 Tax=Ladona fulva TaxID=123851 RepID=A0A8K0K1P1_LADFU|nr:hypothetical protein J437_LFUL004140 [Ladona fulva]
MTEESSGSDLLKRTLSRTSVVSQRPLSSPVLKRTQRSHSLRRSTKSGASTLKRVSTISEEKSKIPTQNSKKDSGYLLVKTGFLQKESSGSDLLKRTLSRTSVVSQRPLSSPVLKRTQRSHSLRRSTKSGASTLKRVSTISGEKSKIPTQNSKITGLSPNKDDAEQNSSTINSTIDINKLSKPPKSLISSVLSVPTTAPTKSTANHAILKRLPSKGVVGVRSSPNTVKKQSPMSRPKSPIRIPPSGLPKPTLSLTNKENTSHKLEKKEKTMVLEEEGNCSVPKYLEENLPSLKKEVEENTKLISDNKKPQQSDSSLSAISNNLQIFESLISVISQESMSFCSQILGNQVNLLTNFINNKVESSEDDLQDEKIANYLEEGDGLHQKHDSLKISQEGATVRILTVAKEIISENTSLKTLNKNLEQKLGLLEEENKEMMKQIKLFSEELETEKQKSAAISLRRTQLEQQVRKYSQKVKELEEKSQKNDEQISNQSIQLKNFETQLKQKEEKCHILEQRFNQQLKQCRSMVEAKEKLLNQRESLEIRVNDLKRLKNNLQNEHIKAMESVKNQLNEALKSLEAERNQRKNFEKELKETQERLMQVQEKSLELADVTEFSKAAILSEGSLTASEKEANLFMKLKEVQANFEGATEKIESLQEENERLRTAVFQYMEQNDNNKDINESSSLIKILKSDLALKEETIEQLQKQIADHLKEVKERRVVMIMMENIDNCIEEMRQKRGEQSVDGNKSELTNEEEALWFEIQQLHQRLEDGKSLNENLQHQLAQKQLEVEQRERIMREQAKVLQVRDELLKLLQQKDKAKTGQMTALQAKLEDHERNADTVCKYFSAKSEQLQELYSTLEMKQRKVMQLEEQVKQLEVQQERGQCQRTHLEARIAELELALHEKTYLPAACVPRSSGFKFF